MSIEKNILTEYNLKEIIKSKYNGDTNDNVQTYSFKDHTNILTKQQQQIRNIQEEKRLQFITEQQINILLGNNPPIVEEGVLKKSELSSQNDGFILLEELTNALLLINKKDIEFKLQKTGIRKTVKEVVELMKEDLVRKFNKIKKSKDKNKNIKLHNLYFGEVDQERSIEIEGMEFLYELFDYKNPKENKLTIIKEKALVKPTDEKYQYGDFGTYLNGLPFIVIETKKSGLVKEALKDYMTKETYWNFLACVGTDVVSETFLSSNANYNDYFMWKNYENLDYYNGEYEISGNGLFDILNDLITKPEKLLFYFSNVTMISEDTIVKKRYLKTARIQQFITNEKFNRIIKNRQGKSIRKHLVHHTRTGKSYTFKALINMVYRNASFYKENGFDKVLFYTHDVASVLPSVKKEMRNLQIPSIGLGKTIEVISTKKEYIEKLGKKSEGARNSFQVYIVNMQKINKDTEDDKVKIIDNSSNVLILIDEVHTHQKGNDNAIKVDDLTLAQIREKQFPNASIIAATASPIKEYRSIKKGQPQELVDVTSELYGQCVDRLTPSNALSLNLVTPLNYEKAKYEMSETNLDIHKITSEIEATENQIVYNKLFEEINLNSLKQSIIQKIQSKSNNTLTTEVINLFNYLSVNKDNYLKLSKLNNIDEAKNKIEFDLYSEMLDSLSKKLSKDFGELKVRVKKQFKKELWKTQLNIKFHSQLIPRIKSIKSSHEGDEVISSDKFIPKFFYVLPKRDAGDNEAYYEIFINYLRGEIQKEINKLKLKEKRIDSNKWSVENNIYDGVRFGVDVEKEDDKNLQSDLDDNKPISITNINGDLGKYKTKTNKKDDKNPITKLFEASELEDESHKTKPVDVLVLVRKKLMGYDNPNLVAVFLDSYINDVKMMLQLATRGTTKKNGKTSGFMIDLTYGNDTNVETWKETLKIYDNKSNNEVFIHDFIEHKKTIKKLEKKMSEMKDFLLTHIENIEGNEIFQKIKSNQDYKEDMLIYGNKNNIVDLIKDKVIQAYWNIDIKNVFNKFLNGYLNHFDEINKLYKSLISPKYVLEQENKVKLNTEWLSLFLVNSQLLLDIKNKKIKLDNDITKQEVIKLLEEIFKAYGGVESFTRDIAKTIKTNYKQNIEITVENEERKQLKAMEVKRVSLEKEIAKLNKKNASALVEELRKIELYIVQEKKPVSDTEEMLNNLNSKTNKATKKKILDIKNKFNGSELKYEIYNNFELIFENELPDEYQESKEVLLNSFTEVLSDELSNVSNNLGKDCIEVLSKQVLESVDLCDWFKIEDKSEGEVSCYDTNFQNKIFQIREDLLKLFENKKVEEYTENILFNVLKVYLEDLGLYTEC